MLKSIYQAAVPAKIRNKLWEVRAEGIGPTVRSGVASLRIAGGRPRTVAKVDGIRLVVDLRDRGVGRALYVNRSFADAERILFRRLLLPGDVVADVGANIGVLSCTAGRLVGDGGIVLAVEPDPYNFSLLKLNVRANALSSVRPIEVALGAEPSVAKLLRSPENYGDHRLYGDGREAVDVSVRTLDSVVQETGRSVNFIKLDVQGYEYHVLRGAVQSLESPNLRAVLTEFWPSGISEAGGDPEEFYRMLEGAGFRPHLVEGDGSVSACSYSSVLDRIVAKANPEEPDGAFCNLLFTR